MIKEIEAFMRDGKGKRCHEGCGELKTANKDMSAIKHRIETMIDHQVLGFIV